MISQFVLEPSAYFRQRLLGQPQWQVALAAPLVCAGIHLVSFTIIMNKTVRHTQALLEAARIEVDLNSPMVYALTAYNAAFYLILWLVATGFLACMDALIGNAASYERLFEITAIAFYSQLPYLVFVFVMAILFVPPDLPFILGNSADQIGNSMREYRGAIATSVSFTLIRNLGYLSQAWLLGLMALGYGVFARRKAGFTVALTAVMYCLFVLGGQLFIDR
ncbi:MAG: YIP1 family protein [Acidobacteriales bacterium]|nr:YIP1 family protein [Terriglobales bacterium]